MADQNFVLGAPVIFTARLSRQYAHKVSPWDKSNTWKQHCKWWQPFPCKPGEGVIVGRRTLSNGYTAPASYDEPAEWNPREYIRAYLVADHIDQKPFYVLPEHLEEWSHGRFELLVAEA